MLLLMVVLAWQESRKPYRFKGLRVLAIILALMALLAMMLRPSRDIRVGEEEWVLLTENYSQTKLDSLTKANRGLRIVRAPGVVARDIVDSISSYRELSQRKQLQFVLGDGIPTAYMDYVKGTPFQFIPGSQPVGVVDLGSRPYPEHRKNWLEGKVRGIKGSRLTLIGPGGAEDSVLIRTNSLTPFELGFRTKIPGRFVYTLAIKDSAGGAMEQEVPVEVVASRQLSILLLQDYPQAEVRFLKNYLTGKGHPLVTRFRLSKNIFRYEVANSAAKLQGKLTMDALDRFDLVVTDEQSLKALSAEETTAMETAVRKGMGLLMLLNGPPESRRFPGDVLELSPSSPAPDTVRYNLGSFGNQSGPFVAMKPGKRVQSILRSWNYVLQGLALCGNGKVGFQSLRETYRLALGGDQSAYAALWTPLLEQTARRDTRSVSLSLTTPFPIYPGEPFTFDLIGPGSLTVLADSIEIPLAEDVSVDDLWHGRHWANSPGWKHVAAGEAVANYFVFKPGSWGSWRTAVQHRENEQASGLPNGQTLTGMHREEIPAWIFFLVFVVAMGFVWLAPKL